MKLNEKLADIEEWLVLKLFKWIINPLYYLIFEYGCLSCSIFIILSLVIISLAIIKYK